MSDFPSPIPPAAAPWAPGASSNASPPGYSNGAASPTMAAPSTGERPAGQGPETAMPRSGGDRPSRMRGIVEWVVIVTVALIGAVLMRTFLIQAFFIPSESMVATLQKGDRVLVNKMSYSLHPVHRGDIVVFTRSPGFDPNYKDLIKRVIGLPGESVSGHNGHVYIDGRQLSEPYLSPSSAFTSDFGPKVIAPRTYWVMGDNRINSSDSRVFGAIAAHQIVGRAFVLWWPLSRIHRL